MKATDLMIGDWVVYMGDTDYLNPIKIEGLDIATDMLITSDREDVGFKGVEPIPLTTEILEKNGFTTHLSHCGIKWLWIEKQKFELAIDEENRNKITTALGLIDIEIKYVHELQHALKLCGIEKEIEL